MDDYQQQVDKAATPDPDAPPCAECGGGLAHFPECSSSRRYAAAQPEPHDHPEPSDNRDECAICAAEYAEQHEQHGGAAGSFASEGCPLCPADDQDGER